MSLSSGDEVPHIFTRKSRLQPGESLITSAIRLLQQYLPIPDSCTAANSILFDDLVGAGEQRRWHVERDSQYETLWNIGRSFRRDVGHSDYFAPLLGFFNDQLPELGR